MPTYDYICRGCGHELEITHSIHAPAHKTCPACGAKKLERRIGGAAFQFKGSGFYKTDYRKSASVSDEPPKPAPAGPDAPPAQAGPLAPAAPAAPTPPATEGAQSDVKPGPKSGAKRARDGA